MFSHYTYINFSNTSAQKGHCILKYKTATTYMRIFFNLFYARIHSIYGDDKVIVQYYSIITNRNFTLPTHIFYNKKQSQLCIYLYNLYINC